MSKSQLFVKKPVKPGEKNNLDDMQNLRKILEKKLGYYPSPELKRYNFDFSYMDERLFKELKLFQSVVKAPVTGKIAPGDETDKKLAEFSKETPKETKDEETALEGYIWEAEPQACKNCKENDGLFFTNKPMPLHPNCKCDFIPVSITLPKDNSPTFFKKEKSRYKQISPEQYEKENPAIIINGSVYRELNPKAGEELLQYMNDILTDEYTMKDLDKIAKKAFGLKHSAFAEVVTDNGKFDGRSDVRKIIGGKYYTLNRNKLLPPTNFKKNDEVSYVFKLPGSNDLVDFDVVWNFLYGCFTRKIEVSEEMSNAGSRANDFWKSVKKSLKNGVNFGDIRSGGEDIPAIKAGYRFIQHDIEPTPENILLQLQCFNINTHK